MTAELLDPQATEARDREGGGRWVPADWRSWSHLIRDGAGCLWCGRAGSIGPNDGQMHARAACLACGTVQCNSHSECAACLVGWMPNWSRGISADPARRQCGYKGCDRPAVAKAPRIGRVCFEHLGRVKVRGTTLERIIADDVVIAREHRGGYRFQWRWMTYRLPARSSDKVQDGA